LLEGEQQQQGFAQCSFFLLLLLVKVRQSVGVKSGRKIWYGMDGAVPLFREIELFLSPFLDFPLSGK
jgi:hypothetical protein